MKCDPLLTLYDFLAHYSIVLNGISLKVIDPPVCNCGRTSPKLLAIIDLPLVTQLLNISSFSYQVNKKKTNHYATGC